MKRKQAVFLTAAMALLSILTCADPTYQCTETDDFKSLKSFEEYVECGSDCDCNMFELMCLVRDKDSEDDYTL